jgi:hypothetical protein
VLLVQVLNGCIQISCALVEAVKPLARRGKGLREEVLLELGRLVLRIEQL